MKNIIFIAPPAAGKGTMSSLLKAKYGYMHISTGDLLRDAKNQDNELGRKLVTMLSSGKLVPDEIVLELLEKSLDNRDKDTPFILDGYPRNIKQAEIYDDLLKELSYDMGVVIFLDIDKDTAMKRALSRVVCSKCGLSYNLDNKELSPIKEGICDACGGTLKTRGDDNKETFITRFDTYMKETYPLIEYYEKKNNLVKIEVSNLTADEVFEEVKKVIK